MITLEEVKQKIINRANLKFIFKSETKLDWDKNPNQYIQWLEEKIFNLKVVQPERAETEEAIEENNCTKCPKCGSQSSFDAFLQKRVCLNGTCNHVLKK